MSRENEQAKSSELPQGERRYEPILAKCVRRHHTPSQIIRDKDSAVMTKKTLKNDTCLPREFEPRTIKDVFNDEDWIREMND